MKIETSTSIMCIINPGLYGTFIGDCYMELDESYLEDFKSHVCLTTENMINEIFTNNIENLHGHCFISDSKFESPRFYNYGNDRVDFNLYVPASTIDFIIEDYFTSKGNKFLDFAKTNYGSYDGFVSFFPYEKEYFESAILQQLNQNKFEMAIMMYIMFILKESVEDFNMNQRVFEEEIIEHAFSNGWTYDEEEEG